MSERPPISGPGRIVTIREPGRLYEVEMPNGFRALAVVPRGAEVPDDDDECLGRHLAVAFSPYDMSRCRIISWGPEPPSR